MSHASLTLAPCPEIQDALDEHFVKCNPDTYFTQDEISFVKYVNSVANGRNTLQEQANPRPGKKRTVDLVYTPRILPSELSSTPGKTCASTNEAGNRTETYTIPTTGAHWDERIVMRDLEDICKADPEYIQSRIMAGMSAILRKMDEDLVADLTTLIGEFAPGEPNVVANVKTVVSLDASSDPEHTFYDDVWFSLKNAGYCSDRPVAFGWNEAYRAFRRADAGCCADSGIDIQRIAAMTGVQFIPNRNIPSTFEATDFISLSLGAVQMLHFNENVGNEWREFRSGNQTSMILIEPETGIPFDYTTTYDCGNWVLELDLFYGLVGMPNDAFFVGDPFEGVTQVNHFRITNP